MKNKDILKLNHRYQCERWPNEYFIIFHKEKDKVERPYWGIHEKERFILNFEDRGRDEWMEAGGCWYKLDLSTATPVQSPFLPKGLKSLLLRVWGKLEAGSKLSEEVSEMLDVISGDTNG